MLGGHSDTVLEIEPSGHANLTHKEDINGVREDAINARNQCKQRNNIGSQAKTTAAITRHNISKAKFRNRESRKTHAARTHPATHSCTHTHTPDLDCTHPAVHGPLQFPLVSPSRLPKRPTGQGPSQAGSVFPCRAPNLPTGHYPLQLGLVAPATCPYLPGGHCMQAP